MAAGKGIETLSMRERIALTMLKSSQADDATKKQKHNCPRCGEDSMREEMAANAVSRIELVYICPECGTSEAMEDYNGARNGGPGIMPLCDWSFFQTIRKVIGIVTTLCSAQERAD